MGPTLPWKLARNPWRGDGELAPSALLITSPYDVEARYSRKKSTAWNGYKVHFTETCDANAPHLIVEVTATSATLADGEIVEALHTHLADQQMLPQEHLMDAGVCSTTKNFYGIHFQDASQGIRLSRSGLPTFPWFSPR